MSAPQDTDFVSALTAIVGDKGIVRSPEDCAPYLTDERGAYHGKAAVIVRPETTAEVAGIVRLCAAKRVPIVPQGGNTGLVGAATPDGSGNAVVISMTRMNRVREIDAANYTITVDAGVILADVQRTAEDADRLFPLSLGGEGTARIGGNLSTNAGGTGVLRYGPARDLVLGLEVVLPDGEIWDGLRALRKDNTGYNLKHLFIGGEGTLGIITGCVLKLFPKPTDVETAFIAVPNLEAAIALLARARAATDDRVTAFEWISGFSLGLVLEHIPETRAPLAGPHDHYLLMEISSSGSAGALRPVIETLLESALEDGLILDATLAQSSDQAASFWKLRETVPEAQKHAGPSIKHDVAVPVSSLPAFIAAADKAARAQIPGIQTCAFGHVGDGNVHYSLGYLPDVDIAGERANISRIVHDIVTGMGGSISAEHGIGQLLRDDLQHYKSDVEINLMRRIKAAIDPDAIMNPGKIL